jgi:nucleoredoxin
MMNKDSSTWSRWRMVLLGGAAVMVATVFIGCGSATEGRAASGSSASGDTSFETLFGTQLVDASGKTVPVSALEGKKVGLYFSAAWCPPCRAFTPRLVETYNTLKARGEPFEIVFISSDRTDDAMFAYMKDYKMDWLAVPFDSEQRAALGRRYGVRGIPTLVVIDPSGRTLSTDGRGQVAQHGAAAYARW